MWLIRCNNKVSFLSTDVPIRSSWFLSATIGVSCEVSQSFCKLLTDLYNRSLFIHREDLLLVLQRYFLRRCQHDIMFSLKVCRQYKLSCMKHMVLCLRACSLLLFISVYSYVLCSCSSLGFWIRISKTNGCHSLSYRGHHECFTPFRVNRYALLNQWLSQGLFIVTYYRVNSTLFTLIMGEIS